MVIDRGATFAVTEAGLEPLRERVAPHPDGVPVLVIASPGTGYALDNLNGYLLDAGTLLFALSSTLGASFGRRLAERRGPHATSLDVRGADRAIPLLRRRLFHDGDPHPPRTCSIPVRSCSFNESIAETALSSRRGCAAISFVQSGGRGWRWTGDGEPSRRIGHGPRWVEVERDPPTLHLPVIDLF